MGRQLMTGKTHADNAIDAYIEATGTDRHHALNELRAILREELTGFTEVIRYRMPCYQRDGVVEVGFANQKHHIALYVLRTDVMATHRTQLAPASIGKGCIRYRPHDHINYAVVRSIAQATLHSSGPVC